MNDYDDTSECMNNYVDECDQLCIWGDNNDDDDDVDVLLACTVLYHLV